MEADREHSGGVRYLTSAGKVLEYRRLPQSPAKPIWIEDEEGFTLILPTRGPVLTAISEALKMFGGCLVGAAALPILCAASGGRPDLKGLVCIAGSTLLLLGIGIYTIGRSVRNLTRLGREGNRPSVIHIGPGGVAVQCMRDGRLCSFDYAAAMVERSTVTRFAYTVTLAQIFVLEMETRLGRRKFLFTLRDTTVIPMLQRAAARYLDPDRPRLPAEEACGSEFLWQDEDPVEIWV